MIPNTTDTIYMREKAVIFSKRTGCILVPTTRTLTSRTYDFIHWIVDAYGFLLTESGDYTPKEFASLIRSAYDEKQPNNAMAIKILEELEEVIA